MENQHRQIKGYRELDAHEIALMNRIKAQGEAMGELMGELSMTENVDKRWLAIGQTHLQQGVMALVRCVAKPTNF